MRVNESIYLDYQATTPTDMRVLEVMLPYFKDAFGNPHSSSHILGWKASNAVESAKVEVSALIGALPEEVIFTSGATESNNHVIFSILSGNSSSRRTILISAIEHKCIKESAYFFADQFNCSVKEVPVTHSGEVDLEAYDALLSDDVLLVCVMAVNNEIGVIQDIPELVKRAHGAGALFHCDAAQAPEAIGIDVISWGVDFLSLSAHKMYGPKGIGALFVESSLQESFPAYLHGGGQQSGLRSGTLPTPLCVGFGKAALIAKTEGCMNRRKLAELSTLLIRSLHECGVEFNVNSTAHKRHPGNLNLQLLGVDAESLVHSLQPEVCVSTGSACNSGLIQSSYVLEAIGLTPDQAAASMRISLGRFSDDGQVIEAANLIAQKIANTK